MKNNSKNDKAGLTGLIHAQSSGKASPQGHIHSEEVGGFVDGPGIRYVVFFAGCPLRCRYCHNPDTWDRKNSKVVSAEDLIERISRSAKFLKKCGGGVTFSGGEPLAQAYYLRTLLRACKEMGLHTAFDTSGFLGHCASQEILDLTDLVLLDIKSFDAGIYRNVTGVDINPTLAFAKRLSDMKKPVWIRFVLVPGLTDDPDNIKGLAKFVGQLSNVALLEVLPFHQMGHIKWKELGIPYTLEHTNPPTEEVMQGVLEIFEKEGLPIQRH